MTGRAAGPTADRSHPGTCGTVPAMHTAGRAIHRIGRGAAGAALAAALLAGCASGGGDDARAADDAAATPSFRPDVERTTSTTTDDAGAALGGLVPDDAATSSTTGSAVTAMAAPDLVPQVLATDGEDDPWSTTAVDFRGQEGLLVAYDCPAGGTTRSVWGSGPYTDDSSVCSAGVHAGLISADEGGRVVARITGGLDGYPASTRNGVEAGSWGAWDGSFELPTSPTG